MHESLLEACKAGSKPALENQMGMITMARYFAANGGQDQRLRESCHFGRNVEKVLSGHHGHLPCAGSWRVEVGVGALERHGEGDG